MPPEIPLEQRGYEVQLKAKPGHLTVRKLAQEIKDAAAQRKDVDPDIVAGILWDEAERLSWEDPIQNQAAALVRETGGAARDAAAQALQRTGNRDTPWDVSVGTAQMQFATVNDLIEAGYIEEPEGWAEPIREPAPTQDDRDATRIDPDQNHGNLSLAAELLLDDDYAPTLVAARVQQTIDIWRDGGVDISERLEVLGQLYSLGTVGRDGIRPNPPRELQERGLEIEAEIPLLLDIIDSTLKSPLHRSSQPQTLEQLASTDLTQQSPETIMRMLKVVDSYQQARPEKVTDQDVQRANNQLAFDRQALTETQGRQRGDRLTDTGAQLLSKVLPISVGALSDYRDQAAESDRIISVLETSIPQQEQRIAELSQKERAYSDFNQRPENQLGQQLQQAIREPATQEYIQNIASTVSVLEAAPGIAQQLGRSPEHLEQIAGMLPEYLATGEVSPEAIGLLSQDTQELAAMEQQQQASEQLATAESSAQMELG